MVTWRSHFDRWGRRWRLAHRPPLPYGFALYATPGRLDIVFDRRRLAL